MEPKVTVTFLQSPCAICGKVAHDHMLMMHVGPVCKDCRPLGESMSSARLGAAIARLFNAPA